MTLEVIRQYSLILLKKKELIEVELTLWGKTKVNEAMPGGTQFKPRCLKMN